MSVTRQGAFKKPLFVFGGVGYVLTAKGSNCRAQGNISFSGFLMDLLSTNPDIVHNPKPGWFHTETERTEQPDQGSAFTSWDPKRFLCSHEITSENEIISTTLKEWCDFSSRMNSSRDAHSCIMNPESWMKKKNNLFIQHHCKKSYSKHGGDAAKCLKPPKYLWSSWLARFLTLLSPPYCAAGS